MSERVLVCGSRDWAHKAVLFQALDRLHEARYIALVVHGACRGADLMAESWAKDREVPYVGEPARWSTGDAAKQGNAKAEGVIRNGRMLDKWDPTMGVAFHYNLDESTGTADMVRRLTNGGTPTYLVDAQGRWAHLNDDNPEAA